MFRRKRFSEPAASIPWWPSDGSGRSAGYPGGLEGSGPAAYGPKVSAPEGYGPGGFGPTGYGPGDFGPGGSAPDGYGPNGYGPNGYGPNGYSPAGSDPATYGPNGYGPNGYSPAGSDPAAFGPNGPGTDGYEANVAPPLAAHDPFGGWPAFGDGFSDDFGGGPVGRAGQDGVQGMPGQGHPANGWPLVEGWAGGAQSTHPADPFGAAAAFHPSTHPNGDPIGQQPANGHAAKDLTSAPLPTGAAGSPAGAGALAADQSEGLP
ncbi:MAG TPA: hypothetical protein VIQ30_26265, partial [Pseudonocardia sp.]